MQPKRFQCILITVTQRKSNLRDSHVSNFFDGLQNAEFGNKIIHELPCTVVSPFVCYRKLNMSCLGKIRFDLHWVTVIEIH